MHPHRHFGFAGYDVVGPLDSVRERRLRHGPAQRRKDLGSYVVERDDLDRFGDLGIEQVTRRHN